MRSVADVRYDADNLKGGGVGSIRKLIQNSEFDLLSDGVIVSEIFACERAVDHSDAARRDDVRLGEESAAQHLQTQHLREAFGAGVQHDIPLFRMSFPENVHLRNCSAVWGTRDAFRRGNDAGNRRDALQELLVEQLPLGGLFVAAL